MLDCNLFYLEDIRLCYFQFLRIETLSIRMERQNRYSKKINIETF